MSAVMKNKGGRPRGSTNRRSSALAARLRDQFDLDAMEKLAEAIMREVPVTDGDGNMVLDENDQPIYKPYLQQSNYINALRIIADKTYPTLKSVDAQVNQLPTAVVDMMGVRDLRMDGELIEHEVKPSMTAADLGIGETNVDLDR